MLTGHISDQCPAWQALEPVPREAKKYTSILGVEVLMEFIQSTVIYSTLLVVLGWLSLYLPGLLLLCAIDSYYSTT
jgi:hypothetical protein